MTHSTSGGGRAKNPDTVTDKSKQHNQAPPNPAAAHEQAGGSDSGYRGSGDGQHGGNRGGSHDRRAPASTSDSPDASHGSRTRGG